MITDKNIYKLDEKTFKIHKTPVPLASVVGFACSQGEDQALVLKIDKGGDLVLTLHGDACSAEVISIVVQGLGKK